MDRRQFLGAAAALVAAPAVAAAPKPKLKKAVKLSMVAGNAPLAEKFALLKKLGFAGVEIDSPGKLDLDEANAAQEATGVKIHGAIDSIHWQDTLSSPDAKVRARGLKGLETALRDAKKVGADTALLVPGVARNGVSYQQCWDRSQAEVRKLLPLAAELGVKIAIEVVWNDFLVKPEQLVSYVDAFESPWVGAYFDASNMLKYGVPSETWVRTLGKRMLKMDFKGYQIAKKKFVGVGEGDENWPEILTACGEVGYTTWATAEVNSGGENYLRGVSEAMDRILELK